MERTTITRGRRSYPTGIEKDDRQSKNRQLLLAGVFLLGLMLGRSLVGTAENATSAAVMELITGYLNGRHLESVGQTFLATFGSSLLLLLILFFCSFSAIAAPVIYLIIFLKAVGIGLSYGMLFSGFGWRALPYVTIILMPNAVISSLTLLAAARESLQLSRRLLSRMIGGNQVPIQGELQQTVTRFVMYTCVLAFSALLDGLLLYLFGTALQLQ